MKTKKKRKLESMSESEYIAIFCNEKRIRNRRAVYVSPETHKLLQKAVTTFMDLHVTAMSMVDAILSYHFETNRELLTRLYEEIDKTFNFTAKQDNQPDSEDQGSDENAAPPIVDGNDSKDRP